MKLLRALCLQLLLVVVGAGTAAAQEIVWIRQFGTSLVDAAIAISARSGWVYVAGEISGDAFVRKYDPDGNELWTRQFGSLLEANDEAFGISADALGVYVAGVTGGTLPGQTSSGGWRDAFLRKYDHDGNEVWTRQFGTAGDDIAFGIWGDESVVYVVGWTLGTLSGQNSSGGYDAFVRKYDADGNELWTRQFGSASDDFAHGVSADSSGVYVAGWTYYGTLPGQGSSGSEDAFVRKYDTDGNELWTRQFGTPGFDRAFAISAYSSGVYVVGESAGALPGQTWAGTDDVFVRRYDANGNEVWTRQFGTPSIDRAFGISADALRVYVAGSTSGTLPGETSEGIFDAFVRAYGPTGNELWTRQFGSSGFDEAWGVASEGSGVYVAGWTAGTLPGQTSAGNADAFVAKLSILTPAELVQQLVADVVELNLKQGISNSLDAKLEAAVEALDDLNENNNVAAINALQAFINAVEAQRGIHISETDADAVISAAQAIIAMLGG